MPDKNVDLDYDELFAQVNQTTQLRAGVRKVGTQVAADARRQTAKEGGKATITLREAPQPNGRYAMDVVSDSPDEEYGSTEAKRIRALRSAARRRTR
ncbi:hypothetical protein [Corynebacterium sp. AOP12-C2-36]|uniref:hypothetical protein n=1 Tax=Corynebacterium sp. AOP12-C2-36 TaxID=3457723 RepID=UPI0040333328